MGLDVTALKQIYRTDDQENGYRAYDANGIHRLDDVDEGYYLGATSFSFQAGSYSGYNRWREWLSKKFLGVKPQQVWDAPSSFDGKPFIELINFGDNEGAFGPVTSAKLLVDFNEHIDRLQGEDEWDIAKYLDWRKAFQLASENGLVILH